MTLKDRVIAGRDCGSFQGFAAGEGPQMFRDTFASVNSLAS
jgi:hypothetical protein